MITERNVECVILAGGKGTRLRPLTDEKPKPLVRILDKTVLELVIDRALKTTCKRITVSTGYKADMIQSFCKEKFKDIVCKKENTPLGTAGGVKFCCDEDSDAVLVLSGDAVFDFDLQSVIDSHFNNESDVTIVTSRKEDPTEYGVVLTDDDDNVISFCEKPCWSRVRSDRVNTGIYVISRRVLDKIPKDTQYDFSKELFPSLLEEKMKLKSYFCNGFWCDIGTLDEYCNCNILAAKGILDGAFGEGVSGERLNLSGIHADDGVFVSQYAKVGKNVRICNGSIISSGAVIGDNCDVDMSLIGNASRVGNGSSVSCAIIGENVCVGENCIVPEGTVIGDCCRIADGVVLKKGRRISSETALFTEVENSMEFSKYTHLFKEDGLAVFDKNSFYYELMLLSRALSEVEMKDGKTSSCFCVMCREGCEHLKSAFCAGLVSGGNIVFDCGEGNEALCSFAVRKLEADGGILLYECEGKMSVRIFSKDGDFIGEETERKIVNEFSLFLSQDLSESDKKSNQNGKIVGVDVKTMYRVSLSKYVRNFAENFDGICVTMLRDGIRRNVSENVLHGVLSENGGCVLNTGNKETISVSVSDDGKKVKIRCGNMVLDHDHVCAAILKKSDFAGFEKVCLGKNAVLTLRNMDKNKLSAFHCIGDDGAVCALTFLALVKQTGEGIYDLYKNVPAFEIYTEEYIADVNRGAGMEKLSRLYHDSKDEDGEGIHLHLADGNVTIIPGRAMGFKIISEAQSMEAARELCFKVGKAIKEKE